MDEAYKALCPFCKYEYRKLRGAKPITCEHFIKHKYNKKQDIWLVKFGEWIDDKEYRIYTIAAKKGEEENIIKCSHCGNPINLNGSYIYASWGETKEEGKEK